MHFWLTSLQVGNLFHFFKKPSSQVGHENSFFLASVVVVVVVVGVVVVVVGVGVGVVVVVVVVGVGVVVVGVVVVVFCCCCWCFLKRPFSMGKFFWIQNCSQMVGVCRCDLQAMPLRRVIL